MRASKKSMKSDAVLRIVYPSHLEKQINIASHNLMTIRNSQEDDSRTASDSASACPRVPQATPSLEHGDSASGMIRLGCRLALGESVSIACVAKCSVVLRRVEGKLFVVQRRFDCAANSFDCVSLRSGRRLRSARDSCKRIYRANISLAKVSSVPDSRGGCHPLFAQDDASVVGKSHR